MLDKMRNSSGSLLIWVLFGFIIIAFVLFFGSPSDSLGCGSSNDYSIKVKDKEVSIASWRFSYNGIPLLSRMAMPGNQLRPYTLDYLLQREILAQAAEEVGFQVSNELVEKAIREGDMFLWSNKINAKNLYFKDGGFMYQYLENLVKGRLGQTSIASYKKEQKREMLAYFMKQELINSGIVSEEETRDAYKLANDTVSADYVKFDVSRYKNVQHLTEAEVMEYANTHEKELKKEWELVKARWENDKERLQTRLIKLAKQSADDKDEAKLRIEKAHSRIVAGESFATVAKEVSNDKSASLGGLIGWRPAKSLGYGKEVVEAAKELAIGKVSAVIETPDSYFLILIEERNEKGLSFEQKKIDLASKEAPNVYAKEKALEAAEQALVLAKLQPLKELFVPVAPQNQQIPQHILDQLQQQDVKIPGSESGSVLLEGPIHLAQAGGKPAEEPKKDTPESKKVDDAGNTKILKPTKLSTPPQRADKKPPFTPGLNSEITPPSLKNLKNATRNGDYLAGIGRSKELVSDLFGNMVVKKVASKVYEVNDGNSFVVIQLTDRVKADMEKFKEESVDLQKNLAQAKGMQHFLTWMRTQCKALVSSNNVTPNYTLLVSGSEKNQIPYEPCYSLKQQ